MSRTTRTDASFSLRRLFAAAGVVAALLLVPAAVANSGAPDHFLLGAVPAHGHGPHDTPGPPGPPGPGGIPGPHGAGAAGASGGNLTYHNGPVMHTNTTYAIYWSPPGAISATYQSLINRFFTDVAAASEAPDNVYATDTQYYDTTGQIAYSSQFGGAYVDTTAIPNNPNCVNQYQSLGLPISGCVLDSDIEAAVSRAIAANGWPAGGGAQFFVFTPKNVGSCWSTSGNICSYNYYCAYHSDFSRSGQTVLYANQPYTDTSDVLGYQACDEGQHPNGDFADGTINVTSHEHNEAITDPLGNAWYDASGDENGDKCAWTFGTVQGPSGAQYNQTINGHTYFLQQEWSNASSSCALGFGSPPPAPTITGFTPGSGGSGTAVTISGTNFTGATAVKFNGANATFTIGGAGTINATVPSSATTGQITVTTAGGTATGSTSFTVPASPDFTLDVSPASQTVKRGSSTTFTVTITRANGFTGTVNLTVGGLPGGGASFNPSTISSSGTTSILTITTKTNGRTGGLTLTVNGTSAGLNRSDTVGLTVTK